MTINQTQRSTANDPPMRTRSGLIVVALCFLTIVADGYDLIVYGASVPELLNEPGWDMTPATAGLIGSWTLIGLMVGFLLAGPLTDRVGHRTVIMAGILWFSVFSAACAIAPSPEFMGAARFFAGVGLGGVVPSAVALTVEFAPANRRQLYNGLMMTGWSFGGIIATLTALAVLPDLSWRLLYAISGLFVLIIPAMYFWLPDSVSNLAMRGKTDKARGIAQRYRLDFDAMEAERAAQATKAREENATTQSGYRLLLSRPFRKAAIVFALVCFCANLIVYGLSTWLPALMRAAGYPLGSSLQLLLVLQVGAIIGMIGGSMLADRLGVKPVTIAFFLLGALALVVLSRKLDVGLLMVAVAVAGIGTSGTLAVVYGYIATYFPASCRGTAVGASMGLGRFGAILGPMIGAWLIGSTLSREWNFYFFALPALVAAVLVLFLNAVPKSRATADTNSDDVTHAEPLAK